jgi:hypothetical protein
MTVPKNRAERADGAGAGDDLRLRVAQMMENIRPGLTLLDITGEESVSTVEAAVSRLARQALEADDERFLSFLGLTAMACNPAMKATRKEWGELLFITGFEYLVRLDGFQQAGDVESEKALTMLNRLMDEVQGKHRDRKARTKAMQARGQAFLAPRIETIESTRAPGMIQLLFIPADESLPLTIREVPQNWTAVYDLVGGSVDLLGLGDSGCSMFVDSRGKLPPQSPPNARALVFANSHVPPEIANSPMAEFALVDWIAGDAVIFGDPVGEQEEPQSASVGYLLLASES